MSVKEAEFWRETEQYHDLAEHFEKNIVRGHPDFVTSDRLTGRWCTWSEWAATAIDRYDYNGTHPRNFDN